MKMLRLFPAFAMLALTGCGSSASIPTSFSSSRSYNGTASVGDFLAITLDPVAQTLSYNDMSNGDAGIVPYAINSDGTYALNDSKGNLVAAYEVPDYALLIQAAKTGPAKDQPSLITAIEKGSISTSAWANSSYNYMQFRTAAGGLEVGSVVLDGSGNVSLTSYWPFGALSGESQFHEGSYSASQFETDASGTFMRMADENGGFDYVFGTPNGVFAVDTASGAILGLKKAAGKAFDPSFAGTYKAIYYRKTNASTGVGNVETGTPNLGSATITINNTGQIVVQDEQENSLMQASLTPVADASYLVGDGELQDPCNGLFTFRIITASAQQDVFVTFLDRAVLFSSFTARLPSGAANGSTAHLASAGNSYDYLYGAGLK